MRRLRRLVLVGTVIAGGFLGLGAAPADAAVSLPSVAPVPRAGAVDSVGGPYVRAVAADGVAVEAAGPIDDVTPSSEGMPGAELLRKLLAWLLQVALWGSLASILAGATVYGLAQNAANYNGAYRGKQLAVAGAIGAALAGLAPTAITMLYQAAGGR